MVDDPVEPRLYTTADTARLSGNTASRIEAWTRLGILVPAQTATRGGTRYYSLYSVLEAARTGLLADRGLSSVHLQQAAQQVRTRVFDTVRPEPGFDLHARAAYGFFIESVKGIAGMYPQLAHDPVIKRFVRRAEDRLRNKHGWKLAHLQNEPNVALLVAGIVSTGGHGEARHSGA